MTKTLQRITTEYIDLEDRVRLAGETADGERVVLWLTRRLLDRLLPHLLGWLEKRHVPTTSRLYEEARQGFAQEAARAGLKPEPAVSTSAANRGWLVTAVDVNADDQRVLLNFKGQAEVDQIWLVVEEAPLRQWLGIIHALYIGASWPLSLWPAWMSTPDKPAEQPQRLMH